MKTLILFEEIDEFFIGLGSTKLLDQIDENKFEDFSKKDLFMDKLTLIFIELN